VWPSRIINWALIPQWQIELTLATVGHLRYNPDRTYDFSAPPLEIWHNILSEYEFVLISTGSTNMNDIPVTSWCKVHPGGRGINITYGPRSLNFVPVLLDPSSVYFHSRLNTMYIGYYSRTDAEVFEVTGVSL
jgi:hypothetical protein